MLQRLAALRPHARTLAPIPAAVRSPTDIVATHVLRLPRHVYMPWNRSYEY